MKTRIDREHWERKEYFDFFGSFGEPFWGINFSVDISGVREFAADSRISLFTCLLYGIMKAANAQENFRYRIEENDIVLYDRIHPSFTVAREDRSFCFAFTEYTENFQVFAENLAKEIAKDERAFHFGKRPAGGCRSFFSNSVDSVYGSHTCQEFCVPGQCRKDLDG